MVQVGTLWHQWVQSRFNAYLTPLEALMLFFMVWFFFRRKFAQYVGARLPIISGKQAQAHPLDQAAAVPGQSPVERKQN
jgi:hypothetical protein